MATSIGRQRDSDDSIANYDDDVGPEHADPSVKESEENCNECHSKSEEEVKCEEEGQKKKRTLSKASIIVSEKRKPWIIYLDNYYKIMWDNYITV